MVRQRRVGIVAAEQQTVSLDDLAVSEPVDRWHQHIYTF